MPLHNINVIMKISVRLKVKRNVSFLSMLSFGDYFMIMNDIIINES